MEGSTPSRVYSLDVLRGLALLGLPLMNIINFAMPSAAYLNPYAYGDSDFLHHEIFTFLSIFADQKFLGLFTLLFGAGLVLLHEKNLANHAKPVISHYSRMFFLFLLGCLHYWFIWNGDILLFYAILGMLLYPLHSLSAKVLYGLSLLFFLASMNFAHQSHVSEESLGAGHYSSIAQYYQPNDEQIQSTQTLLLGTYAQIMSVNRQTANEDKEQDAFESSTDEENIIVMALFSSMLFYIILKMTALICLGMGLYKSGVLQGNWSTNTYKKFGITALVVGLLISVFSLIANYANGWNIEFYFEYGFLIKELGSVPTALAYASLIILLLKLGKMALASQLVANVGRMALTNYLMQSVFYMFIFYGVGLGLHGSVSRLQILFIVFAICLFQILFSNLWMKHFLQGPVEWCWRSVSACKMHPIIK